MVVVVEAFSCKTRPWRGCCRALRLGVRAPFITWPKALHSWKRLWIDPKLLSPLSQISSPCDLPHLIWAWSSTGRNLGWPKRCNDSHRGAMGLWKKRNLERLWFIGGILVPFPLPWYRLSYQLDLQQVHDKPGEANQ